MNRTGFISGFLIGVACLAVSGLVLILFYHSSDFSVSVLSGLLALVLAWSFWKYVLKKLFKKKSTSLSNGIAEIISETLPQQSKIEKTQIQDIIEKIFTTVSLSQVTFRLVIGGVAGLGSLLVLIQIKRLSEQNQLITTQNSLLTKDVEVSTQQNALTADNQRYLESSGAASASYEQISRILLNESSSLASNRFALEQIPEAMRMGVFRVQARGDGSIERVQTYPNAEKLYLLLRKYLRDSRAPQNLEISSVLSNERKIAALEQVSFELVRCIYRVFGKVADKPSLWEQIQNARGQPYEESIKFTFEPLVDISPNASHQPESGPQILDLTHLPTGFLDDSEITFLKLPERTIMFKEGYFINGLNLRNSRLRIHCPGLSLHSCDLQGTNLERSTLTNFDFSRCVMHGSSFVSTIMPGGQFTRCEGFGVDFSSAHIEGCISVESKFDTSRFQNVFGIGLSFIHTELTGSIFENSYLSGSKFSSSNLRGCSFHGSTVGPRRYRLTVNNEIFTILEDDLEQSGATEVPVYGAIFDACQIGEVMLPKLKNTRSFELSSRMLDSLFKYPFFDKLLRWRVITFPAGIPVSQGSFAPSQRKALSEVFPEEGMVEEKLYLTNIIGVDWGKSDKKDDFTKVDEYFGGYLDHLIENHTSIKDEVTRFRQKLNITEKPANPWRPK